MVRRKGFMYKHEVNALLYLGPPHLHYALSPAARSGQRAAPTPLPGPKKDLIAALFKLDNYIFSSRN